MSRNSKKVNTEGFGLYIGPFVLLLQCAFDSTKIQTIFWELTAFIKNKDKKNLSSPSVSLASKFISGTVDSTKKIPLNINEPQDKTFIDDFDNRIKNDYENELIRFNNTINSILNVRNESNIFVLIQRLYKLIDLDANISDNALFYVQENGQPITKKELIKSKTVTLQPFLLGILHFILMNKPNDGKKCQKAFHSITTKSNKHSKYRYNSSLDNKIKISVNVLDINKLHNKQFNSDANASSLSLVSESKDDKNLENNINYINNQFKECIIKYKKNYYDSDSYITTIIDPIKKIKFDDLYVQNSIIRFSDNYFTNHEKSLRLKYSLQKVINKKSLPVEPIKSADSKILLNESNYLLLTATEGMGKSMYLRNLYLQDLKKDDILPILILLRSYTSDIDNKSLLDIIIDKIDISHIGISAMDFNKLLNDYHIVLYLDGLDEINVKDGALKESFIRKLKDFIAQFPEVQIIISSRPDYEQSKFLGLEMFTQYYLEDFCDEDAYTYVHKIWLAYPNIMQTAFRAHAPMLIDIAKIKNRDFFQDAALYDEAINFVTMYQEFAVSPLFLTIILNLYKDDSTIKLFSKSEIYLKHFDTLYRNGLDKKKTKNYPEKQELKSIIEELSFKMLGVDFYDISKDKLYDVISELSCYDHNKYNSQDLEIVICEDLAYLNCLHEKYNFVHNSFKEFFAAMYLINQNPSAIYDMIMNLNEIGENTIRSVLDIIKNENINILNEYFFIPYFKNVLGYKINNLSYLDFLTNFRNELILHSGEINGDYIFEHFDTLSYYYFDYYLEYIENESPNYYYEDTNFDELYIYSDGKNNNYHYTMTFFKVEKIDSSNNLESHSTPEYTDIVPDYEAEAYEHSVNPCGVSCILYNISNLPKEYYPNLYDLIYNNDSFIYKILFKKFKAYIKKNLQKFEDTSEKSKYLNAMISKFSQVNVLELENKCAFNSVYVCNDYVIYDDINSKKDFFNVINRPNANTTINDNTIKDFILSSDKYFLFIASAGIGKSMFMRNLMLHCLDIFYYQDIIPIFIEAKNFNHNDLNEYISSLPFFNKTEYNYFKNDKVIIIIDGLDELNSDCCAKLLQSINDTMSYFPSIKIFISSRPKKCLNNLLGFKKVYIRKFSEYQIVKYLNNINELGYPQDANDRINNRFLNNYIRMLEVPLYLSMLLYINSKSGKLPKYSIDVFSETFDLLYNKHDIINKNNLIRKHSLNYNHDETKDILSFIAYRSFQTKIEKFTKLDLKAFLKDLSNEYPRLANIDTELFIEEFEIEIPVLQSSNDLNNESYSFIHKSFKEYLIAYYYYTHYEKMSNMISIDLIMGTDDENYYTCEIMQDLYDLIVHNNKKYDLEYDVIYPYLKIFFKTFKTAEEYILYAYGYGILEGYGHKDFKVENIALIYPISVELFFWQCDTPQIDTSQIPNRDELMKEFKDPNVFNSDGTSNYYGIISGGDFKLSSEQFKKLGVYNINPQTIYDNKEKYKEIYELIFGENSEFVAEYNFLKNRYNELSKKDKSLI